MKRLMTRLFKSNKTQAVRLPKRVAFDESVTEVEIVVVGQSRIISPAGRSWDAWFDGPAVSDDFMAERGQPVDQAREEL
jgi:antitoxin VapB